MNSKWSESKAMNFWMSALRLYGQVPIYIFCFLFAPRISNFFVQPNGLTKMSPLLYTEKKTFIYSCSKDMGSHFLFKKKLPTPPCCFIPNKLLQVYANVMSETFLLFFLSAKEVIVMFWWIYPRVNDPCYWLKTE